MQCYTLEKNMRKPTQPIVNVVQTEVILPQYGFFDS